MLGSFTYPIRTGAHGNTAFALVLSAVDALGWQLVEQNPPGGRIGDGRIEAIDRTLIMRFPDDITIRVRPLAGQTRVDVRSVSRYGRHDFGVNARRSRPYQGCSGSAMRVRASSRSQGAVPRPPLWVSW